MKKFTVPLALASLAAPMLSAAMGVQVVIDGQMVVFTDVPQSAWYATYIRTAAEDGIVNGYLDERGRLTGLFGPTNRITIAEALKIAVEGAGYDVDSYASTVDSGAGDHWASAYVSVAQAEHFELFTGGMPTLNRAATRAEVSSLIASAFDVNMENVTTDSRYTDVDSSTQFGAAIEALSRDSVVKGDTDIEGQATGYFRPTDAINRAEGTKMVIEARGEYGARSEGSLNSSVSSATHLEENMISYTTAGFTPSVLRIQKGDSVTFRNDSTSQLLVASDPHPVHTDLPALDSDRSLVQGEIYIYTFNQIGTWGYHNHLNASHKGSIVVE